MRITAFCPGHITGFFAPRRHKGLLESGSIGAGICVEKGAAATLSISEGHTNVTARVNGEPAPVTETSLKILLKNRPFEVHADIDLQLPCGAGFGTSAAGSLSAAAALCDALGLPLREAVYAAHSAEIIHNTGLGDAAALSCGGITVRTKEGITPYGEVVRIHGAPMITACVLDEKMSTADILTDCEISKRITAAGESCFSSMIRSMDVERLFTLSRKFTEDTGLASPAVKEALAALGDIPSSMAMLGNTIFALGEEAAETLSSFGDTCVMRTDVHGPRVIIRRE